jgi:hypothetical protein
VLVIASFSRRAVLDTFVPGDGPESPSITAGLEDAGNVRWLTPGDSRRRRGRIADGGR